MHNYKLFLLFSLIVFACAPYIYVLFSSIHTIIFSLSNLIEYNVEVHLIIEIAKNPTEYKNIINKMIVPLIAAITISNQIYTKNNIFFFLNFCIVIFSLFAAIVISFIFSSETLTTLSDGDRSILSQFFMNSAALFSMYLMMLIGLKASN